MNQRYLTLVMAVVLLHASLLWALQLSNAVLQAPAIAPIMVVFQVIKTAEPAQVTSQPDSLPNPQLKSMPKTGPEKVLVTPLVQSKTPIDRLTAAKESPHDAAANATRSVLPVAIAPLAASIDGAAIGTAAPAAPGMVAAAPVAQATKPLVQFPVSDAEYLQNSPPPYPVASVRFNEQGRTIVRVLIGANGQAERAEVAKSSGYKRLDDAAVSSVMRWRYVPGKRGGVAEPMWFEVPINWTLN